jgi:putative tryptophan/tyrosine transport system substrate-binding protein
VAAPAQPVMRRVTVILGFEKGDEEGQSRLAAFVETLAGLGWSDGRNIRLDIRWAGANASNYKTVAYVTTLAQSPTIIPTSEPISRETCREIDFIAEAERLFNR